MKRKTYIFCLVLGCTSAFAQSGNHDTTTSQTLSQISLHAGAGFGILGFAYDAGMFYQNAHIIVGIRYLKSHEMEVKFSPFGGSPPGDRPLESVWEIDMYAGRKFSDRDFSISILAGLSVLAGVQRGTLIHTVGYDAATDKSYLNDDYQTLDKMALGIPIEARLGYTPWQYYDLGISYFININS